MQCQALLLSAALLSAGCLGMGHAWAQATAPQQAGTPQSSGGAVNLGTVPVTAPAPGALTIGQPANAEGINNPIVTRQTTGSKANVPLTDVPQDVIIIPQKLIEDRDIESVSGGLRDIAGYSQTGKPPYTLSGNYGQIRGFPISEYLENGLFDNTNAANIPYLGNAERIEVLKGPAALLYGATVGSIGGVVNTITRKPLLQPSYTVGTVFDTHGRIGGYLDFSQPLTADKTWALRFIGDLQNNPTFAQNSDQKTGNFTITLQGKPRDDTALTVVVERVENDYNQYWGVPIYAIPGSHFNISANPTTTANSPQRDIGYRVQIALDHEFNPDWVSHTILEWNRSQNNNSEYLANWNANGTGSFDYSHNDFVRSAYAFDNLINGRFTTFGHENNMVAGVSYTYVPTVADGFSNNGPLINGNVSSPYVFADPAIGPASNITKTFNENYSSNYFVVYVNDVFTITDRLKLSAGVSETSSNTHTNDLVANTVQDNTQSGTAFRVGPIYEVLPGAFLYASYATTFVPQNSPHNVNGQPVYATSPLEGDQIEVGGKVAITDKATATLAFYQLTEKNVLVNDPNPILNLEGVRDQIGEARSRGIEFDLNYVILPGWYAVGSYAYTQVTTTKSTIPGTVGVPFANVPLNEASLWSVYEVQNGRLAGLGFGGGFHTESARTVSLGSPYRMPPYVDVDATAYYRTHGWRFSVNLNNVLNQRYYVSATNASIVYPGEPLAATFRIQRTF